MMEKTVLEIRGLGYRYPSPAGYVEAVKEANYRFTPGKSYAIMGRSGSGKTTLMSVMAGLDVPWKGEVLFNGASVAELDRHKYRRDNIGMIFQSFYLLPQLTARENVELSLELCGYAGDKKKRANELLAEVGLSEALGAKRSTKLSGGEQQRVAIA
ncbi:MAG: ABC transporter, partial [Clostridiales bacterium]